MFWSKKKWAVGVSYRGSDPQLEQFLTGIAAQHGGELATAAIADSDHGLDFNFSDRFAAALARYEMISLRPGVIAATLEPRV
jgi:hypothetical protein